MVDDTLSPVGFDTSKIAKAHMTGQDRFAMACEFGRIGGKASQSAFTRHVLLLGLETLGWTEERMIQEYAEFRVKCLRDGTMNPFESE